MRTFDRSRLLALLLLAAGSAAHAQPAPLPDRVLGLLHLPQVFGTEACEPFAPVDVALFDAPDGKRVGSVAVVEPWKRAPEGGCEELDVRAVLTHAPDSQPLPTRETSYERPAAIVIEAHDDWFRIALASGSAWLRSDGAQFLSLESLLTEGLAYMEPQVDTLHAAPSMTAAQQARPHDALSVGVTVHAAKRDGDTLWLDVETFAVEPCSEVRSKHPPQRGWVPFRVTNGEPNVWFSSRGC